MMIPTPGEILAGLHRELSAQVVPEVSGGVASRQLRAALHALDLVADTWDLQHAYVEADNDDLESTLNRLAGGRRIPSPSRRTVDPEVVRHCSDPWLRSALIRNLELQEELTVFQAEVRASGLDELDVHQELTNLHRRLVRRAIDAAGVGN